MPYTKARGTRVRLPPPPPFLVIKKPASCFLTSAYGFFIGAYDFVFCQVSVRFEKFLTGFEGIWADPCPDKKM